MNKISKYKKFKNFGYITLAISVALIAASNVLAAVNMPIISLSCLGGGLCSMISAFALKNHAQNIQPQQDKTFEQFENPNGVKIEDYTTNQQFTKEQGNTQHYNRSKVVQTYVRNRYNKEEELEK